MKKYLTLSVILINMFYASAQNIDSDANDPLATTTLLKNIKDSQNRDLVFTHSLYNPWIELYQSVVVMVPEEWYDEPNRVFPVNYQIHGTAKGVYGSGIVGTADPATRGEGHVVKDMYDAGTIESCIFVWPSIAPYLMEGPYEKWFLEILLPFIEDNYRASSRGEMRSISGHSMGGGVAIKMAMKYPDMFYTAMLVGNPYTPVLNDGTPRTCGIGPTCWYNQWLYSIVPYINEQRWDTDNFLSVFEGVGVNQGLEYWKILIIDSLQAEWDTVVATTCDHDSYCTWNERKMEIFSFMEKNIVKVLQTKTNSNNIISEDGATDTIWYELERQPSSNVVLTIVPQSGLIVTPSTLTFTSGNWNQAQAVEYSAVDNGMADGERTLDVSYTTSSSDTVFNNTRVFKTKILVADDESKTKVSFVKHKTGTNPPALLNSARYTVSEHAAVNEVTHSWDDTICFPKNVNIILSVGLENPDPSASVTVTIKLVEQYLNQTYAWTPNFATSTDLQGFTDTTITFAPGEIYKEVVVKPTIDQIQEGTEVAQFALTCVSGGYNAEKGLQPIANIGIQDQQIDKLNTDKKILISEINVGPNPGDFAIELFNAYYKDWTLNDLNLKILKDGATDWNTAPTIQYLNVPHGPSIRNSQVLVFCSESTTDPVMRASAHLFYSELNNIDGNDVIGLFNGTTLLDVVGVPGENPAGGWKVEGIDGATAKVMIRKPEIWLPNNNFSSQSNTNAGASEWIIEEKGFNSYLGYHVVQSGSYSLLKNPDSFDPCNPTTNIEKTNLFINTGLMVWPNPADDILFIQNATGDKGTLYSIEGIVIMEFLLENGKGSLAVSTLPSGIYIMNIDNTQVKIVKK